MYSHNIKRRTSGTTEKRRKFFNQGNEEKRFNHGKHGKHGRGSWDPVSGSAKQPVDWTFCCCLSCGRPACFSWNAGETHPRQRAPESQEREPRGTWSRADSRSFAAARSILSNLLLLLRPLFLSLRFPFLSFLSLLCFAPFPCFPCFPWLKSSRFLGAWRLGPRWLSSASSVSRAYSCSHATSGSIISHILFVIPYRGFYDSLPFPFPFPFPFFLSPLCFSPFPCFPCFPWLKSSRFLGAWRLGPRWLACVPSVVGLPVFSG